jgi:hypothetical protein
MKLIAKMTSKQVSLDEFKARMEAELGPIGS